MFELIIYLIGMAITYIVLPLTPLGKMFIESHGTMDPEGSVNNYYFQAFGVTIAWPFTVVGAIIYYVGFFIIFLTKKYFNILNIELKEPE